MRADGATVLTGSFNFTKAGETVVIRIASPVIEAGNLSHSNFGHLACDFERIEAALTHFPMFESFVLA